MINIHNIGREYVISDMNYNVYTGRILGFNPNHGMIVEILTDSEYLCHWNKSMASKKDNIILDILDEAKLRYDAMDTYLEEV